MEQVHIRRLYDRRYEKYHGHRIAKTRREAHGHHTPSQKTRQVHLFECSRSKGCTNNQVGVAILIHIAGSQDQTLVVIRCLSLDEETDGRGGDVRNDGWRKLPEKREIEHISKNNL